MDMQVRGNDSLVKCNIYLFLCLFLCSCICLFSFLAAEKEIFRAQAEEEAQEKRKIANAERKAAKKAE